MIPLYRTPEKHPSILKRVWQTGCVLLSIDGLPHSKHRGETEKEIKEKQLEQTYSPAFLQETHRLGNSRSRTPTEIRIKNCELRIKKYKVSIQFFHRLCRDSNLSL